MSESSSRRPSQARRRGGPRPARPLVRTETVQNLDDEELQDWNWYQTDRIPDPVGYSPPTRRRHTPSPDPEPLRDNDRDWDWDLTESERMQRREDISEEESICNCSADTFDKDENIKTMVSVLDTKMRKMPNCMQDKAFSDILLYIRYLRRKHRKMLLRNADRKIPGF